MPYPLEEVSEYPEGRTMTSTPLGSGSNPTGGVTDGQVVRDASLLILLAALRVMVRSSGILHVETKYHRWKLLLQRGGLVLMEEEGHVISTLTSKLNNQGIRFARVPNWEQKQPNRPYCYSFVSQVFKRYPEQTKLALKEVLLENLLALHLEDKFSFVWCPVPDIPDNLPVWQLSLLEGNASKEARQWQQFQYVRHPYQRVQLLDAANMLARVGQ
jgi:hypothetical protein